MFIGLAVLLLAVRTNQTIREALSTQVFWSAFEAIATGAAAVIAAIVLFRELPRIRRQKSSLRIEGFRYAKEILDSTPTHSNFSIIKRARQAKSDSDFLALYEALWDVLKTLNFVARLVDLGYVDKELVFFEYGEDLTATAKYMGTMTRNKDFYSDVEAMYQNYPLAFRLLREATSLDTRTERGVDLEIADLFRAFVSDKALGE